jgi:GT2 family glycosyltransferase
MSSGDVLLFLDDDAYPERDCLEKVMEVFEEDTELRIGGVGVLIRNQLCRPPSPRAKQWLDFLSDEPQRSYSGKVIGPAVVVGPEPSEDGRVVPVEWLSCTCAAYRRPAFLAEEFPSNFRGYSYMEDVDISVRVARNWKLAVHTAAYIYHDTEPSRFKAPYTRARMVAENRYHVMTATLGRTTPRYHFKFLATLAVDQLLSLRGIRGPRDFANWLLGLCGMARGLRTIASSFQFCRW